MGAIFIPLHPRTFLYSGKLRGLLFLPVRDKIMGRNHVERWEEMKRIIAVLMALVCCLSLTVPVLAQSNVPSVISQADVSSDGSATVTIQVQLIYDETVSSPVFPIPSGAQSPQLNGEKATVYTAASSRMVSLRAITNGGQPGTYSFTISYRISDIVIQSGKNLRLNLQLLSGCPLPIESFRATITLPGEIESTPILSSGYYQENIRQKLDIAIQGNVLAIATNQPLKDHETLHLSLDVNEKMFPGTARTLRMLNLMDLAMGIAAVLAIAYYLLSMRPKLPRRRPRPDAPDGITAGSTPLWLTGSSVDLSLLVVSWAQMGYLRIEVLPDGRVMLHKRMEMGNERSAFENRCFKDLFGRRRILDGTGKHYAELCRSVRRSTSLNKKIYAPRSGKPWIFRSICAISGLLSGVALAGSIAPHSTLLQITVAVVCCGMSVMIQSVGKCLLLRHRRPMLIGAACAAIWLVMGFFAGDFILPALMVSFQFFAGVLSAFGGQRTELGRQALIQLLNLRKFMGHVSKQELQRLLKANPAYFHELAPYALALGMDRRFSRRFERLRLPECTYLVCKNRQTTTAAEWAQILRSTVRNLDARSWKLFYEKLTGK